MKNNALLARMRAKENVVQQATAETYQQFLADVLVLALHDPQVMGGDAFGYDRIMRVLEGWSTYCEKFHGALCGGPEADYLQDKLDQALRQIAGERFVSFHQRYEWIPRVTYERR